VLREQPVLVYASGHEHTLQVLEQPGAAAYVVTGAGTVVRPTRWRSDDAVRERWLRTCGSTCCATGALAQAVEVDDDGRSRRPFATWLGR
jgi:hypothetical protein